MRQTRSISTVVALTVITFTCQAQISTFPSPPPLAPSTDGTTSDSSNNRTPVSGGESIPDQPSGKSPVSAGSGTPSDHTAAPVTPAPVTASTLTSMTALDDKVLLEAGDSISFRVIEDKDLAVPRIVTDTGEVDFPYIGRVKVEGKTCHQVAVEVKRLLEVDYYKRATVIVGLDLIIGQDKTKARDIAWVVGEVRQVGPQELSKVQPMTVSQVILRAGGFGDFADQRKIKVIHRGAAALDAGSEPPDLSKATDAQIIDVKSVFDGKSTLDPIVKPGDYIIVTKRFFNY